MFRWGLWLSPGSCSIVYGLLEEKGIEDVIKPRRNSRLDSSSEPRREGMDEAEGLRKTMDRRDGIFGEFCMAKTIKNITRELMAKACIYNMLINL